MTVIEASSGTYRSRVDGTIVLSVEIEPRYRAEALALFGMPGTPMALAALKSQSSKPERKEVGELCRWAAIRCGEPEFQRWMAEVHHWKGIPVTEEHCADAIRNECGIQSRAELDTNPAAAGALHEKIRKPYAAWLKRQGVAA